MKISVHYPTVVKKEQPLFDRFHYDDHALISINDNEPVKVDIEEARIFSKVLALAIHNEPTDEVGYA